MDAIQYLLLILFGSKQFDILWEEDILNYSPTGKFRGTDTLNVSSIGQLVQTIKHLFLFLIYILI